MLNAPVRMWHVSLSDRREVAAIAFIGKAHAHVACGPIVLEDERAINCISFCCRDDYYAFAQHANRRMAVQHFWVAAEGDCGVIGARGAGRSRNHYEEKCATMQARYSWVAHSPGVRRLARWRRSSPAPLTPTL